MSHYYLLNFYQINRYYKIQTRDRLVNKVMIQFNLKFKFLDNISRCNLYYFLIV
jgi:hypothetical protein